MMVKATLAKTTRVGDSKMKVVGRLPVLLHYHNVHHLFIIPVAYTHY